MTEPDHMLDGGPKAVPSTAGAATMPTAGAGERLAASLAASLAGTGAAVAVFAEDGALRFADPHASRFFHHYAIPALQALGIGRRDVAGSRFDDRVPGVLARLVAPQPRRGGAGGATTTLILARRDDFDAAAEDARRWCSRLKLDAAWLAGEARQVPPVAPATLSRLAELAATGAHAEARVAALQGELDALSGQLSESYEELSLIHQISGGMRVNRSVDDFFLQACSEVIDVMGVRAAGYAITDTGGRAEASAIFGEIALPPDVAARFRGDLLARFAADARPILNNCVAADADYAYLADAGQFVAVPIQRQEKVLGTLFCFDKVGADFTTQDSKLLSSIANETAIYLENLTLFTDARGMMMGLLHALTSAVDAKDAYTCGHSQRVALFGREIAKRAGYPEAFCERVYMSGLLHDVGKIGVPEEVLRKPGKLTDDEFTLMKRHVEIGARILRDVRQIEDLIPGVLHHHERYDGKGYPHNLSGQQIPLIARLLCVGDCFDAMTSNRTYRKALPFEVALMEIRRCAGTQFDPLLADAFLSIGAGRLREMVGSVTDQMAIQLAA